MAGCVFLAVLGVLAIAAGVLVLNRHGDRHLSQLARGELSLPPDQVVFGLVLVACGGAFVLAAVMSLPPGWWLGG